MESSVERYLQNYRSVTRYHRHMRTQPTRIELSEIEIPSSQGRTKAVHILELSVEKQLGDTEW
jgi:hypothetical protein